MLECIHKVKIKCGKNYFKNTNKIKNFDLNQGLIEWNGIIYSYKKDLKKK